MWPPCADTPLADNNNATDNANGVRLLKFSMFVVLRCRPSPKCLSASRMGRWVEVSKRGLILERCEGQPRGLASRKNNEVVEVVEMGWD
jgi:hypothetical protein